MSDTPRTEEVFAMSSSYALAPSLLGLARELERELSERDQRIAGLEADAKRYTWLCRALCEGSLRIVPHGNGFAIEGEHQPRVGGAGINAAIDAALATGGRT